MATTTTKTTPRIVLEACPRCHGDLFLDDEDYLFVCLQCGGTAPLAAITSEHVERREPVGAIMGLGIDETIRQRVA